MKFVVLLIAFAAHAQEFKPLPPQKLPKGQTTNQDLEPIKGPSLNAGDHFEVAAYDPKTRTYKLVLQADKTAGPLITTAENLAKAVNNINLAKALKEPYSLVKFDYTVADGKELDLLIDKDVEARRKPADKVQKPADKVAPK